MIRGWTGKNLREKLKGDLEDKLKELNKSAWEENEEEKHLREQIIFVLNNPDTESDSFELNNPEAESDSFALKAPNSIEDILDLLGNVVIGLGLSFSLILALIGVVDKELFLFVYSLFGSLSSLISGYILKGLSKIIILLSASQVSNNDT